MNRNVLTHSQTVFVDGNLFDVVFAFDPDAVVCDEVFHNHLRHALSVSIPVHGN